MSPPEGAPRPPRGGGRGGAGSPNGQRAPLRAARARSARTAAPKNPNKKAIGDRPEGERGRSVARKRERNRWKRVLKKRTLQRSRKSNVCLLVQLALPFSPRLSSCSGHVSYPSLSRSFSSGSHLQVAVGFVFAEAVHGRQRVARL